jgi:hypothetical protein
MSRRTELKVAVEHTDSNKLLQWIDIVCGIEVSINDVENDRETYEDMVIETLNNESNDVLEELHTSLMADGLI